MNSTIEADPSKANHQLFHNGCIGIQSLRMMVYLKCGGAILIGSIISCPYYIRELS